MAGQGWVVNTWSPLIAAGGAARVIDPYHGEREMPHLTRKQAINRMCRQCIFDRLSGFGTWREQVEACTAGPDSEAPCPLWEWRPVSAGNRVRRRAENAASAV